MGKKLSISVKATCQSCQRKGWSPLEEIDAGSYFEKNELGKGCLELIWVRIKAIPAPSLFGCSQLASLSVGLCSSESARPNILQSASVWNPGHLTHEWLFPSTTNRQLESQLLRTFKGSQKDHPVSWNRKELLELWPWRWLRTQPPKLKVLTAESLQQPGAVCWLHELMLPWGLMLIEHQPTEEDAGSWDEGDAPSDDRCVYMFFCCFHT